MLHSPKGERKCTWTHVRIVLYNHMMWFWFCNAVTSLWSPVVAETSVIKTLSWLFEFKLISACWSLNLHPAFHRLFTNLTSIILFLLFSLVQNPPPPLRPGLSANWRSLNDWWWLWLGFFVCIVLVTFRCLGLVFCLFGFVFFLFLKFTFFKMCTKDLDENPIVKTQ